MRSNYEYDTAPRDGQQDVSGRKYLALHNSHLSFPVPLSIRVSSRLNPGRHRCLQFLPFHFTYLIMQNIADFRAV
jgi:hypothetical protein